MDKSKPIETINALVISANEALRLLENNVYNDLDAKVDNKDAFESLMVNLQNNPPLITLVSGTDNKPVSNTWVGQNGYIDMLCRAACSYSVACTCTSIVSGSTDKIDSRTMLDLHTLTGLLKDHIHVMYRDVVLENLDNHLGDKGDQRLALLFAFEFLLHHLPKFDSSGYGKNG